MKCSAVMRDLRAHQVDILTLGQYLRPSPKHLPIIRYVPLDEFAELKRRGYEMGFRTSKPDRWCEVRITRATRCNANVAGGHLDAGSSAGAYRTERRDSLRHGSSGSDAIPSCSSDLRMKKKEWLDRISTFTR